MKTSAALVVGAVLLTNVAAYPQLAETITLPKRQDGNTWAGPGPGDARTACPGLNTLANHGFINRNGRGITLQQMQQGFLDAFGFSFEVTQAGGNNALNLQGPGATTFDLDTLNQPHQIEHDGSLSRDDLQMAWSQNADNFHFNQTIWGMTLDLIGPETHYDASSANTARLGRVEQARQQDFPGWFIENAGGSLAEHGFILTCMNDPTVGTPDNLQARMDWIDYWISNERLPTDIGWVKPTAISNDLFNGAVAAVSNAPTTVPQPRTSTTSPTSSPTSGSMSVTSSGSMTTSGSMSTSGPTMSGPSTIPTTSPASNTTLVPPTTRPSTYPITTSKPYPTGSMSNKTVPTTTPGGNGGSTTLPSVPPSVTSSATAVATQLAGPPPAIPNGYVQQLSNSQWMQLRDACAGYVKYVEIIIVGLCGAHGVGGMPLPGGPSPSSGAGGAPWYGGMGPSGGGSPSGYGGSPAPPANTCACK